MNQLEYFNELNKYNPDSSFGARLKIKITATSCPSYRKGEVLEASGLHVFPRKCYHNAGIFRYYVTPYKWGKA